MRTDSDDSTQPASRRSIESLDLLHDGGVWTVTSASQTVYRLDLDRHLLRREPGPFSPHGPFDNEWVPLVRVEALQADLRLVETTDIQVGRRHLYLTDPYGDAGADYRWWLQRTVELIERSEP